jgi:hypothetical protein
MKTKYDLHDIIVYDHQGVLTATSIVKIEIVSDKEIYHMANGVAVLEDNIRKSYGNLRESLDG